ncbi:uncharacterized protein LOC127769397 [Oryza glaberrima]|uniref:Uncharacterized protein n=1 Tax=Oryza barthii TaxID=65489 RepID=A0A0D3FX69_9ORYZ|nr:uncharacterized protein LOC127769397 [Oryza glaberrima]
MAASAPPPPPPLPHAHSDSEEAPVSLFIDTDLGTRFALLAAGDSTMRDLKSTVAAEHATAFPDIGPVAVKSFQVRRKGALYHLSDLMTIRSAFAKIKAGCFLHVKMTVVVTDSHCCRDTSMEDRGKSSEGCPGAEVHVDKCVLKIPVLIPQIANRRLPGLENSSTAGMEKKRKRSEPEATREVVSAQEMVKPSSGAVEVPGSIGQVLLQKNNQELQGDGAYNVELTSRDNSGCEGTKHVQLMSGAQGATDLASDQGIDDLVHKAYKEPITRYMTNSSGVVAGAEKPTQGRRDEGAVETSKMEKASTSKSILEEIQSAGNPSQGRKRKKAKKVNSVDMASLDIADQCGTEHVQLMSDAQATANLVADQGIDDLVHKEYKDPTMGDMVNSSEVVAGAEKSTKGRHDEGVVETSKMESASTSKSVAKKRKKTKNVSSVDMASLDIAGEKDQCGTKHVQFVSDAQATTNSVADKGIDDLVHKDYKDPTMGDMVNSSELVACAGESTKVRHDESGIETSKLEKSSKSILEEIQSVGHTSQQKKRKKAKKVSSVDMESLDISGEKDQCGYGENLVKSDKLATQGKIVNDPVDQHISSNMLLEGPNVIENPCGDGRRKKKKKTKHHSESSKDVGPTHDVTKSLITNEISMQNTNVSPLDPKQITPATTGVGTIGHQTKFDVSLDVAAAKVIDEVLADLRCTDNISKDLDQCQLTKQKHQGSDVLGVHGNTVDKGALSAVLPLKYPAAIHSDAPISSPSHNKAKGEKLEVLPTAHDSSHFSGGVPEENANAELRESVSLRPSDNTSVSNNISTENVVVQDDDKNKATKRQRKKISLKHVPTDNDKTIQSLDEQVNQVAIEDLNGSNATKADLVQGGSVIDGPAGTVENVQKKSRSTKIRTPKVQKANPSAHFEDSKSAKDSQGKCVSYIGESGTHSNETAVGAPTQSFAVQEDATALRTSTPSALKGRKKSSKTGLQSQNASLDHGSDVDLMNYKAEHITASPKKSAVAVEPNEKINFLDHFSPKGTNDQYVSAENKENGREETVREVEDESNKREVDLQSQLADNAKPNDLLQSHHIEKTTSTNNSPGDVGVPSDSTQNVDIADGNDKKGKQKKRKKKSDLLNSVPQKVDPNSDHRDIDNGIQDFSFSVAQEGRMEHDRKENNNNVIWNSSMLTRDPKDATCDSRVKKLNQSKSGSDNQGNLPIDKDHALMDKGQRKSSSQTKPHAESKNFDRFSNGKADPNSKSIRNLVKSFSMSPPASSDSTQGTPQNSRFRLAARKVPRKRYEQTSGKSKKDKGTGTIFNDASSDGSDDELGIGSEKAAIETSSDDASSSADSGISSAAHDSGEPDDDGNASLSQKSRKGGLGSILRGSCSYKKAKQKQAVQLDDTEVPDSQPMDIF